MIISRKSDRQMMAEAPSPFHTGDRPEPTPNGGSPSWPLSGDRTRLASGQPRVMVVDDDPVIGVILAGALNQNGYEVKVFQDSMEALESFDRLESDLVVADWIMPGMDGLGLIGALKRKDPSLPAILITGHGGDAEAVKAARRTGLVDVVLLKPFDLGVFLNTVSSFLPRESLAALNLPPFEANSVRVAESGKAGGGRELYFEKILESIIDAVVIIDGQGRIIYRNRGAERMFELSGRDCERLNFIDLCPPDSDLPRKLSDFFKPHPPLTAQNEAFFLRSGGKAFYADFSVSLFELEGRGSAVILVIKDINDRHLMEQRVTKANHDLERLAMTDPLTGCYNRRHLDRRLDEEFKRVSRYKSPLTLIMLDFDHFKLVNDYFGHLVGDQVLRLSAGIMADSLRQVDVLARWGGEEFMALLPETGLETGLMVAKRLHRLIADSPKWAELAPGFKITASLGLVSLPWANRRPGLPEVLETLDRALYRAKESGRNRIVRYADTIDDFETV